MKNLAQSQGVDGARAWFAALLWRAFPGRSEREVATKAARVLGVSSRQVQHWLRGENDASLRHVVAVLVVAGAEVVLTRIEGKQ